MATLLAVDGTNLAHRAHHALNGTALEAPSGEPMWVLHGVVGMLARGVSATRATSLIVAFDSPGGCPTRRALAPEYKAGRSTPDPLLVAQLNALPAHLAAAGIATVSCDGWEADDLIASAVTLATGRGATAVVLSSDKDLHQLIGDGCRVLKPEGQVLGERELQRKYGVVGARWVEYAALVGERSDNLPGVTGIGPKRATALIAATADVEDAIADPTVAVAALGEKLAAALVEGAAAFRRNRAVGTLRRDLPIDVSALRLDRLDLEACAATLSGVGVSAAARRFTSALAA